MAQNEAFEKAQQKIQAALRSGASYLDLSYAGQDEKLTKIPESIGELTRLNRLDLSFNQLTELPESIGKLTQLQTLKLNDNNFTALPEPLRQLTRLSGLYVSNNQVATLPQWLSQFTGLAVLDFTANKIVELPDSIGRLSQLRILFLDDNQLTSLPESLQTLRHLTQLFLHGNQSLGLPPEVLGPTWRNSKNYGGKEAHANPQAILNFYFRAQRDKARPLREAKILVLGQGAVGKTSLMKVLTGNSFDPLEATTHGINITEWQISPVSPSPELDGPVRVKLWDFGGQEIMHATHQFFLTKRSLYLLVIDSRKGENESNLNYWLKIIQSYGGDSPVLVVMNKSDEYRLNLNERAIMREYAPNVRGFAHVSAKTGEGIDQLREDIQAQISSLPHVFNLVPNTYFEVKSEIEQSAQQRDFLDVREFADICARHGLNDAEEQKRLLRFLHDLGSVLNFDDPDDPYGLKDTTILNPEWVTSAVYRIINNPFLKLQREGELEVDQLGLILDDPKRYPKKQHTYIMEIMRKFELCFEFPNSKGTRYLIPELLSVREPNLDWPEGDSLVFEYHYEVLPSGIISRLIVRNSAYIGNPPVYWRTGVVFHIRENKCLVRADTSRRRITIEIKGEPASRPAALSQIRKELDHIHRTIPKLEVSAKIPLPDEPKVLVDYNHLLKLEELEVERFIPEGANRQYDVRTLLTGIQHVESKPTTLYVRKLVLENIRCFTDLELEFNSPQSFRPMTMLLGDNGVGKTTVLRALGLALCDETGSSSLMSQLPGEMLHAGADHGSITVVCGGSTTEDETWEIKTVLTRGRGNKIELKKEIPNGLQTQKLFMCGYGALRRGFGDKSYQSYEISDSVRSLFDYAASLQNPELVFRRIEAAGHDLRDLREKLAQLLGLTPNAVRIAASGISISGPWGEFTPVGAVGDGYQATLAWLADFFGWALFYDERFFSRRLSGVVLVDEIEKHLHPRWQRQIIRELHDQFPDVQFIVTSHSPICAGGVSDLDEGDGALYHFSSDQQEPVSSIEPPAGWRYDQIITSSAFGLTSPRDATTEEIQNRLRQAHEEHGDKASESPEFQQALEELASRSVTAAQDEIDRQTRSELANELAAVRKLLEAQMK